MNKILSVKQAIKINQQLQSSGKRMVLVGGCFDILHLGHVIFLEKAKEQGDVLFVWVESDEMIRLHKGASRPIHTQEQRARVVAALESVDYVILLPVFTNNADYDGLVKQLKPAIIATTNGDPEIAHKKRSAKEIGARVVSVTKRIEDTSTSSLANRIAQEM